LHDKSTISYVYKTLFRKILFTLFFLSCAAQFLIAENAFVPRGLNLEDYYRLLNGRYSQPYLLPTYVRTFPVYYSSDKIDSSLDQPEDLNIEEGDKAVPTELNLDGEIYLNLQYGGDFSLKKGVVVGAGSAGITSGLKYDLIERIRLEGSIGDRLFVEFDYDSERTEEGILEESNTYSIMYKGKEDEFLKEATLGNKYLTIEGSRYVPIDEGNPDSFALRAQASWRDFYLEGLLRYDVATEGKKQFKGYRKNVDMRVLDVDYVKGRFFFLPDTGIDVSTLQLYKTADGVVDLQVDGKDFVLLGRGVDYDFDNTTSFIYLEEDLELDEELIVYYEKNGNPVGSAGLGTLAIVNNTGTRVDFEDNATFTDYFCGTTTRYLYLRKQSFNSYWELRNIYYLEELEGENVYNVEIEILYTLNSGINSNYDSLIDDYEIDTTRGIILFNFSDGTGFYPRPFPGEDPFNPPYPTPPPPNPTNPFDSTNPIYGGINYPTSDKSITTLHITYSYSTESFFLDFNLVPGSVKVKINGITLDPAFYDVDHDFGIISFSEGVITPASDIEITYKYNPFGEGDKSLFTALGLAYEGNFYRVQNLTSYRGGLKGKEAPEVGSEPSREIVNSTEFSLDLEKDEDEQEGVSASLKGGVAFAITNKNAYGSAIIADMEKEDYVYEFSLNDEDWIIASESYHLPITLGDRGNILYKNYYKKTLLSGDVLQTLSWDIPSDQVFAYSEKAGPYNTADKPTGGNDSSLVIDYVFDAVDNPYATIVTSLNQENLEGFERFNMQLKGDSISGPISIYVELLKVYEEDIDGDGFDTESSINELGFEVDPPDGEKTVIGTNREGKSNGKIDSEDLNGNGKLDTGSEDGVLILGEGGTNYIKQINIGDQSWEYVSVDVQGLSDPNKVFQYANALRITVQPASLTASGKIVINKIWFSGSSIVNNRTDYINISDVSVYEDSVVNNNAFSKTYPGLYEELHGDDRYRSKHEYVEKVLKVKLTNTLTFPLSDEVSLSRRFGNPVDLTSYREFRFFLFNPASQTIPSNLDFTLTFLSSQGQSLQANIPGTSIKNGWNEIFIELKSPYNVKINGTDESPMTPTGTLKVLKRVSEIKFAFNVTSGNIVPPTDFDEIWLDEWHVSESINYFDKAFFTEGGVEYSGELLSFHSFPVVENPFLTVGYERLEGSFYEDLEYKSDRYYTDMGMQFCKFFDAGLSVSKEVYAPIRNEEELPNNLETDGYTENFSHSIEMNLQNDYIPVLQHNYERTVTENNDIELTKEDYRYKGVRSYSESLGLGEYVNFPFGLYHSYSFSRSWLYENTLTGEEPTFDLESQKSASVNQINDALLTYSWKANSVSMNFIRDKTYNGSYVPNMETWLGSYSYKLGSLLGPPEESLEDAAISSKGDTFSFDISMPLQNRIGAYFNYAMSFDESNFKHDIDTRNTLASQSLYLAVPFYFLGNEQIEVSPSLTREISADYKDVEFDLKEIDILHNTGKYIFMHPFYYINPLKGLGRIKDYDAVDEYKSAEDIFGNTTNTLKNEYSLDTYFQYDRWYIPSSVGLGVYGETKREGENYIQKRGFDSSLDKSFYLNSSEEYFDKSIILSLSYSQERDYATKILAQTYGIQTDFTMLKEEWKGIKIQHSFTYGRERQKISKEKFYLFPGSPEKEIAVSEKPYKDKIDSKLVFEYLWEYKFKRDIFWKKIGADLILERGLRNTERFTLENIYTFTDREKAESFSNIPVRATLEHESSYRMSENIEFGMHVMTVIGVEEKVIPPSTTGNILPSMGLELGMYGRIIF
jgi:hypothetical protein